MKEQIIVFEPNMNGPAHTEINAGLLQIIQNIHSDEDLLLIADEKHYKALIKKINLENWLYQPVKVLDYTPLFLLINEIILSFRILKFLFLKRKVKHVYFLGILPFSHILLSFLNKIFKKDIIIALHGQMEAYLSDTKIGKTKYYYYLSKKVFKQNDGIRYIIFGESIKKNLKFLFNGKDSKIITIDQPYMFDNSSESKKTDKSEIITLGVIGRADNSKNISELFILIDELKDEIEEGKINIKIVGKVYVNIPADYKKYLTYHTEIISNETFEKEIRSLDYALSFTNEKFYRATPSGVLFDCIKWDIPIYGLKNDYIQYYFDSFGEFGYLFSSTKQMAENIKLKLLNIVGHDAKQDTFQATFEELRMKLGVENLTLKMKNQL